MGWRRFLDSLDTGGGHIVILLALAALGVVSWKWGYPGAQAIVGGAMGALWYSMRLPKIDK